MSDVPPGTQAVQFLIVDADQEDRRRIRQALSQGFPDGSYVEVSSKRQWDAALAQGCFDAVLTEFLLPWSDGLKILRTVKKRFPQRPVIWVGQITDEKVLSAGKQAGLNAYIAKPQLEALVATLRANLAPAEFTPPNGQGLQASNPTDERDRVLWALTADYAYALSVTDQGDLTYEWVSDNFTQITGYTLDELVQTDHWTSLIHCDDQPMAQQRRQRWLSGQADVCEWRIHTRSGQERWLYDRARPVWDMACGRVVRIYGAGQDITQRKRDEELSHQMQKMELIGRLAGGIAHDFNNLLQVITGYSDMLLKRLNRQRPIRHYAQEIRNVAEQGAFLTRQLMAISRMQPLQPQVMDLRRIITNMIPMLHRVLGENVELVTVLDPALGHIYTDPGQFEQVLLNLAANAREAMPHGGQLTIEAANIELDCSSSELLAGINPGPYIRLHVQDTGRGMKADVQAHIFEPFFTTKESGKGMGLGLFTAYGIVSQNGGHMTVASTAGVGTTFTIYLPRVDEPVGETKPGRVPRMVAQRGETILLVEDEAVVRDLVRQILQGTGYTVLEAATGEEALQLCTEHVGPLHLLLADVVLPGISGPELARRLALLRSPLQVLYMSGYAQDAMGRHSMLEQQDACLQKPFTPDILLRVVRGTLDATPTS